jgi:hypothetical protein
MPRPKRGTNPGSVYHLIPRFVGQEWFVASHVEREKYLQLLGRALTKSDWICIAFAIMSNHIHLGLLAGEQRLGLWLKEVHEEFADWINWKNKRIGAVFVKGAKLIEVRPDGIRNLVGYIHRNPVRARVATDAVESDWTSHRAYAGIELPPSWLDVQRGLGLAGYCEGRALDAWVRENAVTREQNDAGRVKRARSPGRWPDRSTGSDPIDVRPADGGEALVLGVG